MACRLWFTALFAALPALSLTFQSQAVLSLAGQDDDLTADGDDPPADTRIMLPTDVDVLVFAFDRRSKRHMTKTVFRAPFQFKHVFATDDGLAMNVPSVEWAFKVVEEHKPKLVLWLVTFKDGDIMEPSRYRVAAHNVLPALSKGFAAAKKISPATRHGVFHWSPEFCNVFLPVDVLSAYRAVDFVFQFGYQDERLSSADPKYRPWPLGTADLRGWTTPDQQSLRPMSQRKRFTSFRGSNDTRPRGMHLDELGRISGVTIESRETWTFEDSAEDGARYRELMATSQYTISPAGHNPNCFRVQEAVESGSIPVIVRGTPEEPTSCHRNWLALYGLPVEGATKYPWIPSAPFHTLARWDDFEIHVGAMRAGATDRLGVELQEWYAKWLAAFHNQLELQARNLTRAHHLGGPMVFSPGA